MVTVREDVRKTDDMPKDRLTERQTDRRTERQIEDKTTFQPSYQNKSCSECQQDARKQYFHVRQYVSMSVCQNVKRLSQNS